MPRIVFVTVDGARHEIDARPGDTVMEIGRDHDLGLEGTCGGALACATCHVVVEPDDFRRLAMASPEEEDMLDFATGVQPTSRLGCQIRLCAELDGLQVKVPPS